MGVPPKNTTDLGDDDVSLVRNERAWELLYKFRDKEQKHPLLSVAIPVQLAQSAIDYQKQAVTRLEVNWFPGTFLDSFSDLSLAAKNKESFNWVIACFW